MFSVKSYTLSSVLETRMVANKYRSPLGRQPACGARKNKTPSRACDEISSGQMARSRQQKFSRYLNGQHFMCVRADWRHTMAKLSLDLANPRSTRGVRMLRATAPRCGHNCFAPVCPVG